VRNGINGCVPAAERLIDPDAHEDSARASNHCDRARLEIGAV
jgi:hypothetical protein